MSSDLQARAINTLRFLSADAVQQANSGHPGFRWVQPQWLIPSGLVTCDTIRATQSGLDVTASFFRVGMVPCFYILCCI